MISPISRNSHSSCFFQSLSLINSLKKPLCTRLLFIINLVRLYFISSYFSPLFSAVSHLILFFCVLKAALLDKIRSKFSYQPASPGRCPVRHARLSSSRGSKTTAAAIFQVEPVLPRAFPHLCMDENLRNIETKLLLLLETTSWGSLEEESTWWKCWCRDRRNVRHAKFV